jgi:hypothetical protein
LAADARVLFGVECVSFLVFSDEFSGRGKIRPGGAVGCEGDKFDSILVLFLLCDPEIRVGLKLRCLARRLDRLSRNDFSNSYRMRVHKLFLRVACQQNDCTTPHPDGKTERRTIIYFPNPKTNFSQIQNN